MAPPAADGNAAPRIKQHERAFASACFSVRRRVPSGLAEHLDLSCEAAQALADVLPILMCGEASAEWVFEAAANTLADRLDRELAAALRGIAEDEQRHGLWLAQIEASLPAPTAARATRGAARFLRRLSSTDAGMHISRVASLDAGVCLVLAEACARGTPIAASPALLSVFTRIRRDEGRHVRISRRCAAQLGVDGATELKERRAVLTGFAALLAPKSAALAVIGIDLTRLRRRFDRAAGGSIMSVA